MKERTSDGVKERLLVEESGRIEERSEGAGKARGEKKERSLEKC